MVQCKLLWSLITVLMLLPLSASALDLSSVHLNTPRGSNDVKPGDLLKIDLQIENKQDEDLQDIAISAVFRNAKGALLRDERNEITNLTGDIHVLRKSTSVDRTLSFRVPYTVEDTQRYTLELELSGYTPNRSVLRTVDQSTGFTVDKLPHELVYQVFSLTPTEVECGKSATLSIVVRNIGNANEDAVLTAVQPELLLNLRETSMIQKDYDRNNTYAQQFAFQIPLNTEPRTYDLRTVLSYDKGEATLQEDASLTVRCAGYRAELPSQGLPPPVPPAVLPPAPPRGEDEREASLPEVQQPPAPPEPASPAKRTALFIGIGIVLLIALALLAFIILRLRRIRRILR